MIRRSPRPTRTATLLPDAARVRSAVARAEPAAVVAPRLALRGAERHAAEGRADTDDDEEFRVLDPRLVGLRVAQFRDGGRARLLDRLRRAVADEHRLAAPFDRSEEHTSELQSLMRISYAVFCLKKKKRE